MVGCRSWQLMAVGDGSVTQGTLWAALATVRAKLEGAERAPRFPDEEAEALARIRRQAVMASASLCRK